MILVHSDDLRLAAEFTIGYGIMMQSSNEVFSIDLEEESTIDLMIKHHHHHTCRED